MPARWRSGHPDSDIHIEDAAVSGRHARLLGCSFEAFAIDDELIGASLRAVRGIEVNEETLSVQLIDDAIAKLLAGVTSLTEVLTNVVEF